MCLFEASEISANFDFQYFCKQSHWLRDIWLSSCTAFINNFDCRNASKSKRIQGFCFSPRNTRLMLRQSSKFEFSGPESPRSTPRALLSYRQHLHSRKSGRSVGEGAKPKHRRKQKEIVIIIIIIIIFIFIYNICGGARRQ